MNHERIFQVSSTNGLRPLKGMNYEPFETKTKQEKEKKECRYYGVIKEGSVRCLC